MLDRLITTRMSANIIASLIKQNWTVKQLANAIKAPEFFIRGVQARTHVLTMKDIQTLARRSRQSPYLMVLNSVPPSDIQPGMKELFDSIRAVLEASAACGTPASAKATTKKRRPRKTAA